MAKTEEKGRGIRAAEQILFLKKKHNETEFFANFMNITCTSKVKKIGKASSIF